MSLADFCSHTVAEADLLPGDHIYVHRLAGLYQHHGIYVGEGQAIHWWKKDTQAPIVIERTSLEVFRDGQDVPLKRVRYDVGVGEWMLKWKGTTSRLHADADRAAIVARAEAALLDSQHAGVYHLLFNNCEKFARFCVTSLIKEQGEQVLAWIQRLALLGAVAITPMLARYLLADLPHLLPHVPLMAGGSVVTLNALFIWVQLSEQPKAQLVEA